jgi:hypothetical protein
VYEKIKYVDKIYFNGKYILKYNSRYFKMFARYTLDEDRYTDSEIGLYYKLMRYTSQTDNTLTAIGTENNVVPLTEELFAKLKGKPIRRIKALFKKLREDKIIKKVSANGLEYYMVNPLYCLNGKRITENTWYIYRDELAEEIPNWAKNNFRYDLMCDNIRISYKEI